MTWVNFIENHQIQLYRGIDNGPAITIRRYEAAQYRDLGVKPGHTYEYQAKVMDHDGNESELGSSVIIELP